jgi:hypothetical protein
MSCVDLPCRKERIRRALSERALRGCPMTNELAARQGARAGMGGLAIGL